MRLVHSLVFIAASTFFTGVLSAQSLSPVPVDRPAETASPSPAMVASPSPASPYLPKSLSDFGKNPADADWPSLKPRKTSQTTVPFRATQPAPTPSTPLDSYQERVRSAVGKAWYKQVDRDLANLVSPARIDVSFWVSPAGKITDVHVITLAGRKHELADTTAAALANVDLPPMTAELTATLPRKGVEMELKFDLY